MAVGTPYVSGGFVVPVSELDQLQTQWRIIKQRFLKDPGDELKWSHFFIRAKNSPLNVDEPFERRKLILKILEVLFGQSSMLPLLYVARKERMKVTDDNMWLTKSHSGSYKLNTEFLLISNLARFAVYLRLHRGIGEVWFDQLGSQKEEERFQKVLTNVLTEVHDSPAFSDENRHATLQIMPKITFLDSKTSEAVQIADFICGALFRGARGNMDILSIFENKYNTEALKNGVGILRIED